MCRCVAVLDLVLLSYGSGLLWICRSSSTDAGMSVYAGVVAIEVAGTASTRMHAVFPCVLGTSVVERICRQTSRPLRLFTAMMFSGTHLHLHCTCITATSRKLTSSQSHSVQQTSCLAQPRPLLYLSTNRRPPMAQQQPPKKHSTWTTPSKMACSPDAPAGGSSLAWCVHSTSLLPYGILTNRHYGTRS